MGKWRKAKMPLLTGLPLIWGTYVGVLCFPSTDLPKIAQVNGLLRGPVFIWRDIDVCLGLSES